jgi:hypothetical protein
VKGALAGGQQAMQLISVWCPYCLCHHTHGIDAAMPSWAITHRIAHCPGGRTPFDQIGSHKMAQVALGWHNLPCMTLALYLWASPGSGTTSQGILSFLCLDGHQGVLARLLEGCAIPSMATRSLLQLPEGRTTAMLLGRGAISDFSQAVEEGDLRK